MRLLHASEAYRAKNYIGKGDNGETCFKSKKKEAVDQANLGAAGKEPKASVGGKVTKALGGAGY